MVDLAYAAVFFNEEKLAREVGRLEERMNGHLRRLRIMAMLAARSPEDAEGMAGVLWIADAIERIGDAASDIARVVAARLGIPDALRQDLRHADEMTARVKIRSDAPGAGRTLRDLSLPTETGMWVMAIRSGMDWRVRPGAGRRGERARRAADPRAGGGREPGARARRRGAPPRVPRGRHPGALRARSCGRHPGGAQGPRGGGGGPRVLVTALQQQVARGRGRRDGSAERHPPRRAGVVGAPRGARSAQPRRAPRSPSSGERERVRLRLRARHDVVRRAR